MPQALEHVLKHFYLSRQSQNYTLMRCCLVMNAGPLRKTLAHQVDYFMADTFSNTILD